MPSEETMTYYHEAENTHRSKKYHCTAGLQFDSLGHSLTN